MQRERDGGGWTPELASRALGALRIAATYAIGRPVSQMPASRLLADGSETAEPGRLILKAGWPRGKRIAVSGAVTPQTVARARRASGTAAVGSSRCSRRCRARLRRSPPRPSAATASWTTRALDEALATAKRLHAAG